MKLTIQTSKSTYNFDTVWGTTADRVAFERRFGVNASVMSRYFNRDGQPVDNRDGFRDEWIAFLAWRALRRHDPSVADFDDFIEQMENVVFGGDDEENPTETPGQPEQPTARVVQLG